MIRLSIFCLLCIPRLLFSQEIYVGSKNSDKYHYTSCQWAKRINASNLVTFNSPEVASKAGYVPCKVCKPIAPKDSTSQVQSKQRIKKQSASTQTSSQCAATTKKGTRCKRKAKAGSAYCWQHGG